MNVTIEPVVNGYFVTDCGLSGVQKYVCETTEQLFAYLLNRFEDRGDRMHGDHYGKVSICRDESERGKL